MLFTLSLTGMPVIVGHINSSCLLTGTSCGGDRRPVGLGVEAFHSVAAALPHYPAWQMFCSGAVVVASSWRQLQPACRAVVHALLHHVCRDCRACRPNFAH